ncbi:MAG: nucleotidyltransferase family protein [Rubrivivax sp.]|jgi:molybdenum cofactor cytidylyltransferase|nr:nucleotidyltransferase family protein [Rubrivivax sp.]MBK8528056.1 nucleotidyltransferase family protein [Rubrivivax sp.]
MRHRPTIVVLAAGQGSRFAAASSAAAHKLEQGLGESTVLGTTLGHVIATACPFVVVTTARLVPLASTLVARCDLVVISDDEARRGVGHSIAAGVAERPMATGWLVLPGDMPMISSASILAVAEALAEHPVAFSQYHGRRGHPVGFAAELFSELIELDGDEGARRIVARYPAHGVTVDDPGVLVDIDTPADLSRVRSGQVQLQAGSPGAPG